MHIQFKHVISSIKTGQRIEGESKERRNAKVCVNEAMWKEGGTSIQGEYTSGRYTIGYIDR